MRHVDTTALDEVVKVVVVHGQDVRETLSDTLC
jgi:hypothetical protein